jgi:hypothetical protein
LSSSGVIVRKSKLEEVSYWTTDVRKKMATDYDLWLKLAFVGARFKYVRKPLGDYRLHDRNESHDVAAMMDSALCVVEDHFQKRGKFGFQDQIKYQRARAFYMYVAARGHTWAGERKKAIEMLIQAFKTFPLLGRIYYAGLLLITGSRVR